MPAPSIVQTKTLATVTGSDPTITFDSNVTAGNALVCLVSIVSSESGVSFSFSDSLNGAWSNDATQDDGGTLLRWSGAGYYIGGGSGSSGGSCTITVSKNTPGTETWEITIFEIENALTLDNTFDSQSAADTSCDGFDPTVDLAADSIAFGNCTLYGTANITVPSGWTEEYGTLSHSHAYDINTTLQSSVAATFSEDEAANRLAVVAFSLKDSGGGGLSLTAETGAFSLAGINAGLSAARSLTADSQSYALAGPATGVGANRKLTADARTYSQAGVDAALTAGRKLGPLSAAFSLTGTDTGLTYNEAGGADYTLSCSVGVFTLTGQASAITASRKLSADLSTCTLTGLATGVKAGRRVSATLQAFALTGVSVNLAISRNLAASAATYTLAGTNTGLSWSGDVSTVGIICIRNAAIAKATATATIQTASANATLNC